MQPETLPEVKSRPVYSPVEKNHRSEQHVFVCVGEMPDAMADVFSNCDENSRLLLTVNDTSEAKQVILNTIATLPLATTVYVAGDESFLWYVSELYISEGMMPEQIRMFAPEVKSRHVFCCHCYHVTTDVTTSPAECGGCGRLLAVTDHFARKTGAYLGYQVNAEVADEIPETEELS